VFRYTPPKSSVWGHGLRGMPISRVQTLFNRFLEATASEFHFNTADLWTSGTSASIVSRYEALVGKPAIAHRIADLGQALSERWLAQLIEDETEFRSGAVYLSLTQEYDVAKWKCRESDQVTPSRLTVHYNTHSRLGTALQFESLAQFEFVRDALEEVGLCKLNSKHLKPIR
jgi:hypothetical protein